MRQVDGAILMASEFDTKSIKPLFLRRVPVVTTDRRSTQIGCSDVAINFEGGFFLAVQQLRQPGHRQDADQGIAA